MVEWRRDHPESTKSDAVTEEVLSRIVAAYHAAKDVFAKRGLDITAEAA
jgi:hypothetical protein